jgi:hypothetical protein
MKARAVLSVGARLSKLRAMSAAEIGRRVRYKAWLEIERRRYRAGTLLRPDRLARAVVPSLAGTHWSASLLRARRDGPSRFFPGAADRAAMRALFAQRFGAERDDTVRRAAEARAQRFGFFGREFAYDGPIPWQHDPVTGREWPAVYHADVPVHGGDVGYGDVKDVWELSRQQFLIDLAKSWFLTGNADDLQALTRLVRSWIAGNPYATGVNWSCALEPAFRVFSWLWAYELTADALDDELHLEWLTALLDHGRFIEHHFEHYTSPYNHLIGEASALYMLGAFLPELSDAPRWRRVATTVLSSRLGEQFYADGGSVEQSTFYHHATVGFYLLAFLSARCIGDELPAPIPAAIERGLEFSLMLTQPDGFTPTIGGADDGKPIRMEHLPFWDFRPYLAIGAVLFQRGDFKAVAGRFYEDALWLLGPAGLEAFEALPATPPRHTSEARPESGYFVLRSGWSPRADYACIDCGEQAAGMRQDAVPNSMHGHADCLSLVAWLDGRRVLVDSGLYSYNAGGAWEAHFRETAAHCTATVDGRDQAYHIGKMAWSHSYVATAESWHPSADGGWFTGSHNGYERGPSGVRHRRTVWLRPGSCLVVYDEFAGTGRHDYAVHFQFAPGELRDLGGGALFDGEVEVRWTQPWSAAFARGGEGPAGGWIAPSLGIRTAAPRFTLTHESSAPHVDVLTVLMPRAGAHRLVVLAAGEAAIAHAMAVVAEGFTDLILVPAANGEPGSAGTARIAVCRVPVDRDAGVAWEGAHPTASDAFARGLADGAREVSR